MVAHKAVPQEVDEDPTSASASEATTSDGATVSHSCRGLRTGPAALVLLATLSIVAAMIWGVRRTAFSAPVAVNTAKVTGLSEAPAIEYMVRGFVPYFNYDGELKVKGTGGVSFEPGATSIDLFYHLIGLDPNCTNGPGEKPNSCGIHIHAGTDCETDAKGHFFNAEDGQPEPWKSVTYTESGPGGHAVVTLGLPNTEVLGKTLIVHDHTGARIACGIIDEGGDMFGKYPGYKGNLEVLGSTKVADGEDGDQIVEWWLTGVDPACTEPKADTALSCGIHIHKGTSCSQDALGHYFNNTINEDPWKGVTYKTEANGGAEGSATVVTGLTSAETEGHTMIVHDIDGARIACGIIMNGVKSATQVGAVTKVAMILLGLFRAL